MKETTEVAFKRIHNVLQILNDHVISWNKLIWSVSMLEYLEIYLNIFKTYTSLFIDL